MKNRIIISLLILTTYALYSAEKQTMAAEVMPHEDTSVILNPPVQLIKRHVQPGSNLMFIRTQGEYTLQDPL